MAKISLLRCEGGFVWFSSSGFWEGLQTKALHHAAN
jgi:hypothetical protein